MKKFLSMVLLGCFFCLSLGLNNIYANENLDRINKDVNSKVSNKDVETFKKNELLKKINDTESNMEIYRREYVQYIKKELVTKDSKYNKILKFMNSPFSVDADEMIAILDDAIAISPKPIFHYYKAMAYDIKDDFSNALIELETVDKKDRPKIKTYYTRLANCRKQTGKGNEIETLSEGIKVAPERGLFFDRAQAYKQAGNEEAYSRDYKTFLMICAAMKK